MGHPPGLTPDPSQHLPERLPGELPYTLPGRLPPSAMFPVGDPRFRVRYVPLQSGLTLRTVECGDPTASDVVLCAHGWACSVYSYRFLLPLLAERGMRAVAVDLPGHGLSDKPAEMGAYTLDAQALSVLEVLDALGTRRARLVGHSMGGPIVARAAVLAPERVTGLALLAPAGFGHEWAMRLLSALTPRCIAPALPRLVPRWAVKLVFDYVYGTRYHPTPHDVDEYWAPSQFPAYTRAMWGLLHAFPWTAGEREGFAAIRVPTVVMDGTRDHLVLHGWVRRYVQVITGSRLIMLDGAGHVIPEEAPHEVANAIAALTAAGAPAPTGTR